MGVAIAGLTLTSLRRLRTDLIGPVNRLDGRMGLLDGRMDRMDRRMDHLEGLLEGMREAIVRNQAA